MCFITAASAFHPRFLQHRHWRSDTPSTLFSLAATELARMLGSGISKHRWEDRFLSSSSAGHGCVEELPKKMRETEAYSRSVYIARDGFNSLPLRHFMFAIHTIIQWHSALYSPWVIQMTVVLSLKWKQRFSCNTVIPAPGKRVSIVRIQIKLRVGNKAIQVGTDLHQYSARDRTNSLGLHCAS